MRYTDLRVGRLPTDYYGCCYKATGKIVLDIRKDVNILKIFLHELLHLKHPEKSERWIRSKTRKVWRRMSAKQKWELGLELFAFARYTY